MALFQDKIYPNLPVFAQNLAITAYGYYWHKRRFGGIFHQELRKFKERENFTVQQWRDYQTVELRKLLVHAFETVPLYRERYSALGFTKSQFERFELEDLSKLPFLTKEDLRRYGTTTLLSSKREKGGQFFSSSGSTGTPTRILFSLPFHQRWSAAYEARIRHWAGVDRFHSRGMIGGRRVLPKADAKPPFHRYNWVEKQVYFSAYHLAPKNVIFYLDAIYKHKVKYMTGYAMSNFFLANMISEQSLKAPELLAVITSSEKLTNEMRKTLSQVYGCKVYDGYSGVEACGLISETSFGELLVSPDVGIMEIINEYGEPVKPGETGEIISTGLLNYDQPLIRYRIGDTVTLSNNQKSQCGRNMPVIKEINGRVEDKIVGPDGRQMVRFHSLYVDISGLVAAQIIQEKINKFTINLVVDSTYKSSSEQVIIKRLKSQLGEVDVDFYYMDEIPKNTNGKFQAVISRLKSL
ncbi:MAG: phenylacetate--CoA ligase family protein [Thermaurantimonas sp.]|uniref:phenylacetate--CoA ligase family protein n=1 Tax=Thermaurantimonas sp. TaxID=2681568 RepID=UPI00391C9961